MVGSDALSLLRANLGHPAHRFWADDISFLERLNSSRKDLWDTSKFPMLTFWDLQYTGKESWRLWIGAF
jgi:hypothetical protein